MNNYVEIVEFFLKNNLTKPPVARKLAVRHKIVCLTASFLDTGGFEFVFQNACMDYKHAYLNIFCCILHLIAVW